MEEKILKAPNGLLTLFILFVLHVLNLLMFIFAVSKENAILVFLSIIIFIVLFIMLFGIKVLDPQEALVLTLFNILDLLSKKLGQE